MAPQFPCISVALPRCILLLTWSTAQVPEQKSPVVPSGSFIVAIKHLLNTLHPAKARDGNGG